MLVVLCLDDHHAHLLAPAFVSATTLPGSQQQEQQQQERRREQERPSYASMAPEELDALLGEMEQDVRNADRDMREIELLVQKGVLAAGKLPGTRVSISLFLFLSLHVSPVTHIHISGEELGVLMIRKRADDDDGSIRHVDRRSRGITVPSSSPRRLSGRRRTAGQIPRKTDRRSGRPACYSGRSLTLTLSLTLRAPLAHVRSSRPPGGCTLGSIHRMGRHTQGNGSQDQKTRTTKSRTRRAGLRMENENQGRRRAHIIIIYFPPRASIKYLTTVAHGRGREGEREGGF